MRAMTATLGGRTHLLRSWISATMSALLLTAGAGAALIQAGHGGWPAVASLVAFFLLIVPYAAFLSTSFARDVGVWLTMPFGRLGLFYVLLFAYLVYAVGTGSFAWSSALRITAFTAGPILLLGAVRERRDVTWQDFAAILWIWLPFDFGLLKDIWTWPDGGAAYVLNTALAVNLAVALFVGLRGFRGVTPRFQVSVADLRFAASVLAVFLTIAVPLGFGTDFITWNPKFQGVGTVLLPVAIFLFIALPEELLFRGLLQNFLERRIRPGAALAVTSVFFGATHLNNGLAPDWRYFLLATGAGVSYGLTYRRTRGLTAPALLHAAVDTIWVWFFHV